MKFGGDFYLAKRQAVPVQTIGIGSSINGKDIDCKDLMEALITINCGTLAANAELSGALEKKNRITAAYTPLQDREGNNIVFGPLIQGSPNDPTDKTLRARVDCRALPEDENIIRVVLSSAVGASPVAADLVATSRYELPGSIDENADPLTDPVMVFGTQDALIQGNP